MKCIMIQAIKQISRVCWYFWGIDLVLTKFFSWELLVLVAKNYKMLEFLCWKEGSSSFPTGFSPLKSVSPQEHTQYSIIICEQAPFQVSPLHFSSSLIFLSLLCGPHVLTLQYQSNTIEAYRIYLVLIMNMVKSFPLELACFREQRMTILKSWSLCASWD